MYLAALISSPQQHAFTEIEKAFVNLLKLKADYYILNYLVIINNIMLCICYITTLSFPFTLKTISLCHKINFIPFNTL